MHSWPATFTRGKAPSFLPPGGRLAGDDRPAAWRGRRVVQLLIYCENFVEPRGVGRWRLAKIMRMVLLVFNLDVLVFFEFVLVPMNILMAILILIKILTNMFNISSKLGGVKCVFVAPSTLAVASTTAMGHVFLGYMLYTSGWQKMRHFLGKAPSLPPGGRR